MACKNIIFSFGWTIRMAEELESDSVALERVYGDLPHEAEVRTEDL